MNIRRRRTRLLALLPLTPGLGVALPDSVTAEAYPGYGDCLAIVELEDTASGKPFASGAVESASLPTATDTVTLSDFLQQHFPSLRPENLLELREGSADGLVWRLEAYPKSGFYTCRIVGVYATAGSCWVVDFAATASRGAALDLLEQVRFVAGP